MRIIKKQSALRDMEAIVDYIAQDNPAAAQRFIDSLQHSFLLLAQLPLQGVAFPTDHPQLQNIRKCVIPAFRHYLIFYQPLPDGIEVIRVLHAARDVQTVLENTHAW